MHRFRQPHELTNLLPRFGIESWQVNVEGFSPFSLQGHLRTFQTDLLSSFVIVFLGRNQVPVLFFLDADVRLDLLGTWMFLGLRFVTAKKGGTKE